MKGAPLSKQRPDPSQDKPRRGRPHPHLLHGGAGQNPGRGEGGQTGQKQIWRHPRAPHLHPPGLLWERECRTLPGQFGGHSPKLRWAPIGPGEIKIQPLSRRAHRQTPQGKRNPPPIYRLALTLLGEIETAGRTVEYLILFQAKLLSAVGYRPNLTECIKCGKDLFEKGGVLRIGAQGISCPGCSPGTSGRRLSPGSLRYLDRVVTLDTKRAMRLSIPKSLRGEIQRFLLAYVMDHSGVRFQVPKFFDL